MALDNRSRPIISRRDVRACVCVPATSCADGLSQVGTLVSNLWGTSPTLCRPLLVGYLRKKRLVHTYTTLYKGGGRRKEVRERERKGFVFFSLYKAGKRVRCCCWLVPFFFVSYLSTTSEISTVRLPCIICFPFSSTPMKVYISLHSHYSSKLP